jgi:hypothetical protein
MFYSKPVAEIIKERFSCRRYLAQPLAEDCRGRLAGYLASLACGPLGTPARYDLVAATEGDRRVLKGLGTYGVIRGSTGFIVGAARASAKHLEDYGYLMERAVLFATDMGLGTCWLGGTFTKSGFARKIGAMEGEDIPAVTPVGYKAAEGRAGDLTAWGAGSSNRLAWEKLFFHGAFGVPLPQADAGPYAVPLEMVRLGPSASNKQPWRVIGDEQAWHFYLQRTRGYRDNVVTRLMRLADLQRVDIGIAMCHFELTASELGLQGHWAVAEPGIARPDPATEYVVSWMI